MGLMSQRPEQEFDEGPDNLWKLPNGSFLVIECKNGSESKEGISKGDLGQLGQSIEWFEGKYGANEAFTPIIIHPRSNTGPQASAIDGCRVIDGHRLRLLKAAFIAFITSVAEEEVISDVDKVQEKLVEHRLTGEQFLETYTVPLT